MEKEIGCVYNHSLETMKAKQITIELNRWWSFDAEENHVLEVRK